MFGSAVDEDNFQRETTPMHPVSPYGCSKLYAYSVARTYRQSYGLFISNGILFNHESPRRGTNFVTAKVVKGALEIKYGKKTITATSENPPDSSDMSTQQPVDWIVLV